jgi:hypothetical protein
MHQRVLPHVNHPGRQHVNHLEHPRVNQEAHPRVNHPLYDSQTHRRVHVSLLEFPNLHVSQAEHPVIVVAIVEVPGEAVVLVGVVPEEAVVEDANNRFLYLEFHSNDLKKVKLKYILSCVRKMIFFEFDSVSNLLFIQWAYQKHSSPLH